MIETGWQPTRARAVAIVLVALTVAGCGGSSIVKPATYVRSVCLALGNWRNTIQSAQAALGASGAATASRPVAKEDYQRFVGSLLSATRHATHALQAAGTPSVAGGRRIARRLTAAFRRATRGLVEASAEASSIQTDSAAIFQLGAMAVSADIRSALDPIARVSPGQNGKLRAAAANEPACQVLAGS